MAEIDQVAGGGGAGVRVGDHDRVREFAGVLVIEQHDRHAHFGEHRHVEGAHARRGDYDAIHAALFEGVDYAYFALRVGARVGQKDGVVAGGRGLLDSAYHFRRESVGDGRDHDPDRVGAAGGQAASHGARAVAGFSRDAPNPLDGFGVDARAVAQRAGHRGVGDAGQAGDVFDGGGFQGNRGFRHAHTFPRFEVTQAA